MGCRKLFNPLHLEVIRLDWQRLSNVELGVHVKAVSKAINSPAGQELLAHLRDKAVERMLASFVVWR